MSIQIDKDYINRLSTNLEHFEWQKPKVANCRCPMCGDSKQSKHKTRFFFYEKGESYKVYCHNCGYSSSLQNFIKETNPSLYSQYRLESFVSGNAKKPTLSDTDVQKAINKLETRLLRLPTIASVDNKNEAKAYCLQRKLPIWTHSLLRYASDFGAFAQKLDPTVKFATPEPRLVIPFFAEDGTFFAAQGRSLDPKSKMRYLTIRVDGLKHEKIFGMERVDKEKRVYCFEGPLDSLFIPNSIALGGASVMPEFADSVSVFDNEPRNPELCRFIEKTVNAGHKICLIPEKFRSYGKDINDMVLSGLTSREVKDMIDKHTYSGATARLEYAKWKKI